jgi:hypothetical protein
MLSQIAAGHGDQLVRRVAEVFSSLTWRIGPQFAAEPWGRPVSADLLAIKRSHFRSSAPVISTVILRGLAQLATVQSQKADANTPKRFWPGEGL